ncbi:MAG: carboxypeptidase-like regulatory domain-containing protein [Pirellulaceae bacterium]
MIRNKNRRHCFGAALGLALIGLSGCSDGPTNPPTFQVTGKVTYKNKPVEGATVVLVAQEKGGKGAVGNTDAEGNYSVGTFEKADGAVVGGYRVKVFKYDMVAEPPADGDDVMSEEEEEENYGGVEDEEESKNLLPLKYEDAFKSGFSVEVVDKAVVLDMDL